MTSLSQVAMINLRRVTKRPAFYTVTLGILVTVFVLTLTSGYGRTLSNYLRGFGSASRPSGPRVYRYNGASDMLTIIDGRHSLYSDRVDSMSDASLRILYRHNAHLEITANCKGPSYPAKAGRGWNLCLAGPYIPRSPCFDFSFGNRTNWQFENNVANHFRCQVFAFDPHMSSRYQVVNENPFYLREGLYDPDRSDPWLTESYLGHLKRFNAENLLVDVLKIDTGDSVWSAVDAAVKDGSLKNVKQLLIATPVTKNASMESMKNQMRLHAALHQSNFRLWHRTLAVYASNEFRYQLHFVNANFAPASESSRNVATSVLQDPLSHLPVVKLPGFDQLKKTRLRSLQANYTEQLANAYERIVNQLHIHCPHSRTVGDPHVGGWDVCLSSPFDIRGRRPCTVFSFGIRDNFLVEDKLADEYHCSVHMFDMRMNLADHQRRKTSWFHRAGLAGNSTTAPNGGKLRTLCAWFSELGFADKEIDVLKIDTDALDWHSLEKSLDEGCLKRVRQIVLWTHTSRGQELHYAEVMRILVLILEAGFATWNTHFSDRLAHQPDRTEVSRPCCFEHYLVNRNLLSL